MGVIDRRRQALALTSQPISLGAKRVAVGALQTSGDLVRGRVQGPRGGACRLVALPAQTVAFGDKAERASHRVGVASAKNRRHLGLRTSVAVALPFERSLLLLEFLCVPLQAFERGRGGAGGGHAGAGGFQNMRPSEPRRGLETQRLADRRKSLEKLVPIGLHPRHTMFQLANGRKNVEEFRRLIEKSARRFPIEARSLRAR